MLMATTVTVYCTPISTPLASARSVLVVMLSSDGKTGTVMSEELVDLKKEEKESKRGLNECALCVSMYVCTVR